MRFFCAAFTKWYETSGFNLVEAGAEFDLSHTFISKILKRQASISIGTAELIANKIGKDLIEMLLEGRALLGEKPKFAKKLKTIDPHQEAKDAFDFLLLYGGETAELIEKNVLDFAQKKQAEEELQIYTPAKTKVSA
jgi:hypothetical protein